MVRAAAAFCVLRKGVLQVEGTHHIVTAPDKCGPNRRDYLIARLLNCRRMCHISPSASCLTIDASLA